MLSLKSSPGRLSQDIILDQRYEQYLMFSSVLNMLVCAKLDALTPAQHEHIDLHTLQIYRNNVFLFSAGHCYI